MRSAENPPLTIAMAIFRPDKFFDAKMHRSRKMNRFDALKRWTWSIFVICVVAFGFAGCEGDDGAAGPPGPQGPPGADGNDGADGTDATADPLAAAKVESPARSPWKPAGYATVPAPLPMPS